MSFRAKTVIGIALIEAIFLSVLVWQAIDLLAKSNQEALVKQAQETANLFGTQIKNALISSDLATLAEMTQQLTQRGAVEYVRVIDERGVLASSNIPDQSNWVFERDTGFSNLDDRIYDVTSQVTEAGVHLGIVQLGLPTQELSDFIRSSRKTLIGIAIAELVMVALVSLLFGHYLTRSLTTLTRQVSRLASGDLQVERLPDHGKDELAIAARAFNLLADSMKDAKTTSAIKTAVYDASLDAMITINDEGIIEEFSSAAETLLGWKREEVIGKNVESLFFPSEHREEYRSRYQQLIREGRYYGQTQRRDSSIMNKSGKEIPVEVSTASFLTDKRTYVTAFIRDITQQIAQNEQLVAAKDKAEEANKAKSRFLSHMSHEIRSPLNAVLGAIQLMSREQLSSEQRKLISISESSGSNLLNVINEILDFSRIESGTVESTTEMIELEELTDNVLSSAGYKINSDAVELVCQIGENVPTHAFMDVQHTLQIIRNLLDNAIKFTEKGLICLTLDRATSRSDQDYLEIRVSDTGRGIPSEHLQRIFEEFEQVYTREDREIGGSGLGLAIVKRLIDQMNGKVSVDSTPGSGTIFTIELPVQWRKTEPEPIVVKLRYSHTILVTENTQLSYALTDYLEKQGVIVQSFQSFDSAENAINLVDHERTLLIMDDPVLNQSERNFAAYTNLPVDKVRLARISADSSEFPRLPGESILYKPLSCRMIKSVLIGPEDYPVPAPSEKAYHFNNKRILVVEDVTINQIVITETLRHSGLIVECANNGLEALECLSTQPYDAVLMDLNMPVMGGIEAVKQLRSSTGVNRSVPVIALTANAERAKMAMCYEAGMNDFVSKPYYASDLMAVIYRQLHNDNNFQADTVEENQGDPALSGRKILDIVVIDRLVKETSSEALPMLLDGFLTELSRRINLVRQAFDIESVSDLKLEAHALKSSSGTFGARALQQCATNLESMLSLENPQPGDIRQSTLELLKLAEATHKAYKCYKENLEKDSHREL